MADINDLKDICISSGTLRAEDLLPKFMGILKDYAPEKFNEFIKGYPELDGWEDFLEADWRIISDDTKMNASDDLFGLLNDIAPEGTMFSSTEGDGADFGFWSMSNESKKKESLYGHPDSEKDELASKYYVYIENASEGTIYSSKQEFDDYASAEEWATSELEKNSDDEDVFQASIYKMFVDTNTKQLDSDFEGTIFKSDVCESNQALKQMAKDGKSTGEVAADIRYDVATALDMAVDKAEDLMFKFGLDKIYVLRAKGLSPKAIANKILKSCESKDEAALHPWRTDFEKGLQKRIDDAKGTKYDTMDFTADGWEFVTGDVYDDGSEYGSAGKDVAVAFFKREQDGQYYRMWLAFDPYTMEITDGKWWIESDESKDERRNSADYLQEVWDALVPVWDKDKFNMAKGYDDEYECEAITITVKDNNGVRAKIYVDDHEGKHPVGFNVIYRYPCDKGVGDLGYYEFQSTDFDETAPEIFAYFDELKGKVGEDKDKFVVGMMISLDGVKQYIREIKPRTFVGQSVDTGKEFTLPLASLNRASVLFDPRTSEKQSEAMGDNWVAYYFCEDPQGLEWAVLPHAINGIGNASCVNSRGGNDNIAIEYVLDECTPIEDVKGSDIYGKVKELEDRDIVALTRDEAERIALADDRLKELKAVVAPKDEAADSRRVDDYANKRFFDPEEFVKYVRKAYGKDGGYVSIDSVVPVSVLDKANRMAQKNGYKKMEAKKAISCNALVAALQEKGFDVKEDLNGSYRIVAKGDNFNTTDNLLFITTLYPESTSDNDFVSDSAFVRGRVNGNLIVATDLKSVEDIVSVCVDAFGKKTETKKSEGIRREALDDDPPEWREHGCASRVFLERFGMALRDSGLPWTLSIDNTIYDMVEVYTDISSLFGFKPSTEVGHIDYESKNVSGNDAILLDIVKECEEDIAPVELAFDGHDGIMRWVTCYLPHASMEGGYAEHIEDDTWPTIPECIDMTLEALDTATNYLKKSTSGLKSSESKKSESLTLKQKELKDMARYGEAEDITTISDAEAKELKKKGIETVGVSRGTYGMNGALLRDRDGNKYVITARSSNLFYFV